MNKFVIFNFSLLWIFLNLFIGFIAFLLLINNNYSEENVIDPNSKFIVVATSFVTRKRNMLMVVSGW